MTDLACRLVRTWRTELRLLCLHWTFPVLHLLWAGLLLFTFRTWIGVTAEAALSTELGNLSIGAVSLVSLIVGAVSASRSARTRFDDLEQTYPTGAEVMLGRWLATVTALLSALIVPLVLAFRVGPVDSFTRAVPRYLLEATITFAFASAIGWCAVVWLGNRRWIYPVLAAGWVAITPMSRILTGGRGISSLLDFTRMNRADYRELWGHFLVGDLPSLFNRFYAGLGLGVLALAVLLIQRRRTRRLPVLAGALVLAGLVFALVGGARYNDLLTEQSAEAVAIDFSGGEPAEVVSDREVIDAWEIDADLRDLARPRFDARMTLRNAGSTPISDATLTLYHDLVVVDSSLPVTRDGDQLTLALPEPLAPGAATEVRLTYEGAFAVYVRYQQGKPQLTYFVGPGGVRLLPAVGWYPVAGVSGLDDLNRFESQNHPPGAFRLTVQAPAGFGVTSNLPQVSDGVFAAEHVTGAFLFAAPRLRTEQVGKVTVAAPDLLLPRARALAARFDATLDRLTPFFPTVQIDGMTFALLDGLPGYALERAPAGRQILLVFDADQIDSLDRSLEMDAQYFGSWVLNSLWPAAIVPPVDPEAEQWFAPFSLDLFLWAYTREEGDPDEMAATIDAYGSSWHINEMSKLSTYTLLDIYRQRGVEGIQVVIDRLLAAPDSLEGFETDEEIAAWYREVTGVS